MRPADEVKKDFVRQWLTKAEEDLRTCRYLLKSQVNVPAVAAFHAQQAAEKSLKAFLVWHQIEFTKTHDIAEILDLVARADEGLASCLQAASSLTPYAAEHRYPGDLPGPTMSDAIQALHIAEVVFEEVTSKVPSECRPRAGSH